MSIQQQAQRSGGFGAELKEPESAAPGPERSNERVNLAAMKSAVMNAFAKPVADFKTNPSHEELKSRLG